MQGLINQGKAFYSIMIPKNKAAKKKKRKKKKNSSGFFSCIESKRG
jgi:hypothetical protein